MELVEQHDNLANDPQHIRYKCKVGDKQEEIYTYLELLEHLQRDTSL